MIVVVDASVALKWFFRERPDEGHIDRALAMLGGVRAGQITMIQPPHFMAEMAAVLAREKPGDALADLADLRDVNWTFADSAHLYETAADLAIRLDRHVFDTLYHAAAMHSPDATLVTADLRYYDAAREIGQIMQLKDFNC